MPTLPTLLSFASFTMAINIFLGWNCLSRINHSLGKRANSSWCWSPRFCASHCLKVAVWLWIRTDFPGLSPYLRNGWVVKGLDYMRSCKFPSSFITAMPCLKISCMPGSFRWIVFYFFFSKWILWQFSIYFLKESLHFLCDD